MFNADPLLATLPDVWKKYFEDSNILKKLYSVLGSEIATVYKDIVSQVANRPLDYVEVVCDNTWRPIDLELTDRLELTSDDGEDFLTIYPLIREEPYLIGCSRIYAACELNKKTYLENKLDYEIVNYRDPKLTYLGSRFNCSDYFKSTEHYIIFKTLDPLVHSNWQQEPIFETLIFKFGFTLTSAEATTNNLSYLEVGDVVTISSGGLTTDVPVIFRNQNEDSSYTIALNPALYSLEFDEPVVSVTLADGTNFTKRLDKEIPLDRKVTRVWGYRCSVDYLELFKRYGWLLNNTRPVFSSENYRSVLSEARNISLKNLSKLNLARFGTFLMGGQEILNDYIVDNPVYINIPNKIYRTNLQEYKLLPTAYTNYKLAQSVPLVISKYGEHLKVNLAKLNCSTYKDLIHIKLVEGSEVSIKSNTDALVARILLTLNDGTFLVSKEANYSESLSNVRLYLSSTEYLFVNNTQYSLGALGESIEYLEGELINEFFTIEDYSDGTSWWSNSNLMIPAKVWDAGDSDRRRVTTTTWPYTIGSMPKHRVGDYLLAVPSDTSSTTYETAYKLFRDFLVNKVASFKYTQLTLNEAEATPNQVISNVNHLKDLSKMIAVTNNHSLIDFSTLPSTHLAVTVTTTPSSLPEQINSAQNTGIGTLDILAYITLNTSAHGITTSTSSISVSGESATCVATAGAVVVLSFGSTGISSTLNLTMLQVGSSTFTIQSGFLTNVVGANQPSRAMVVGNSYPEYPRYYPIGSATVSQNLFIEVI